mgnify:CR=1 FL=1
MNIDIKELNKTSYMVTIKAKIKSDPSASVTIDTDLLADDANDLVMSVIPKYLKTINSEFCDISFLQFDSDND